MINEIAKNGKIHMLALDHRTSIETKVGKENIVLFKTIILENSSHLISSTLIDSVYGLDAYKQLNLEIPFLLGIEKSGYELFGQERITKLESSVSAIKNLGAKAVKLLIYYNPRVESAAIQKEIVKNTAEECEKNNIPFLLELVDYDLPEQMRVESFDPDSPNPIEINDARQSLQDMQYKDWQLIDSVQEILNLNLKIDVFKLRYPGTPQGCAKISELLGKTPWILLSGGDNFEEYLRNYKTALENGCSGFAAGRSLWKEMLDLPIGEWEQFAKEVVGQRLSQLTISNY